MIRGRVRGRMNDKFGRAQGKEKNQKSRCAGVHGLKGIYTDGRYLSARLPSLCSRLTKCLCTRTDPEWIELRYLHEVASLTRLSTSPQTSTVSALLNFKRKTVPIEISPRDNRFCIFRERRLRGRCAPEPRSVSMKSLRVLRSTFQFFYLFRENCFSR